jgi:hypothetical protein
MDIYGIKEGYVVEKHTVLPTQRLVMANGLKILNIVWFLWNIIMLYMHYRNNYSQFSQNHYVFGPSFSMIFSEMKRIVVGEGTKDEEGITVEEHLKR